MNKYDQERIDMIIVMIMYITGLSERKIFSCVKRTKTYLDILSGDELTLYDSYTANLMDMANEWKRKILVPSALRKITEEQINDSNIWLREQKIKDSLHAKLYLHIKQLAEQSNLVHEKLNIALTVSTPDHQKLQINNWIQKASEIAEEPLYKDMQHNQAE